MKYELPDFKQYSGRIKVLGKHSGAPVVAHVCLQDVIAYLGHRLEWPEKKAHQIFWDMQTAAFYDFADKLKKGQVISSENPFFFYADKLKIVFISMFHFNKLFQYIPLNEDELNEVRKLLAEIDMLDTYLSRDLFVSVLYPDMKYMLLS